MSLYPAAGSSKTLSSRLSELVHEYHTKVLGRLIKILNLYGHAQSARLGTNIIAPAAEELVQRVNAEDHV